jgi:GNAT superfamily N-acetyltransferase
VIDILPLQDSTANLTRLSAALLTQLQASGMPLPEDECMLEYLASAVKYGRMHARLAVQAGEAVGAIAWRTELNTGFLLLFCVLPGLDPEVSRALLQPALDHLQQIPVNGIYAELPGVPPVVDAALQRAGFVGVVRHLMQIDLLAQMWVAAVPVQYRLESWQDESLVSAARVIYQANIGTVDQLIIPELQSLSATERIIRHSIDGRYGSFDRAASGIVRREGQVVGANLATRRRSGQGFIAEICVLPEDRRRGLARAMMQHAHAVWQQDGITAAMLGVTAGNPARRLYEALGYRQVGALSTYVWPRPAGWPDPL